MPLYIGFIDLTKAFDLVSRDGLFKVPPKIGCPPKLQSMIEYIHTDTKGTMQPFEIRSSVKQECVLAPMLFGTFIGLLLKHVLDTATEGIYLRPAQMAGYLTSPISEPRQRYARFSSGTCCLLITQQNQNQNQNQNRFIRSYYRPRRPPLRPIWSLSQRPPGKKYIHECMYVKVKLVNT